MASRGFSAGDNLRPRVICEIPVEIQCLVDKMCNVIACRLARETCPITGHYIRQLLYESIHLKRKWKRIRLLGGEPTLCPHLLEIPNVLRAFKYEYRPNTKLEISINGFGKEVTDILSRLPSDVIVNNSAITSSRQEVVMSFHAAPVDSEEYMGVDYANACEVTEIAGVGLTIFGYYPCAVAAGIDRVF